MIRILQGDCRDVLATLPDASVHCVVTSPPYFGLRDYGTASWEGGDAECDHRVWSHVAGKPTPGGRGGSMPAQEVVQRDTCRKCGARRIDAQIGLEPTPDAYIATLVAVFREVQRVLRDDGTCWVNMGDSYSSGSRTTQCDPSGNTGTATLANGGARRAPVGIGKPKDLLMMPARLALALQADGWWIRSDIIWAKPNPMPESCTDRPTSSHEHVFMLTKSARYFYDADAVKEDSIDAVGISRGGSLSRFGPSETLISANAHRGSAEYASSGTRNLRNVWTIATAPYADAHFATFPPELAERCIKAGTSERGCCAACGAPWVRVVERGGPDLAHQRASGGDASGEYHGQSTKDHAAHGVQDASAVKARILAGMVEKTTTGWSPSCACPPSDPIPCTVLDPFSGAFTSAMVADRLQRHAIGIELSEAYCEMARARLTKDAGLFADIAAEPGHA